MRMVRMAVTHGGLLNADGAGSQKFGWDAAGPPELISTLLLLLCVCHMASNSFRKPPKQSFQPPDRQHGGRSQCWVSTPFPGGWLCFQRRRTIRHGAWGCSVEAALNLLFRGTTDHYSLSLRPSRKYHALPTSYHVHTFGRPVSPSTRRRAGSWRLCTVQVYKRPAGGTNITL